MGPSHPASHGTIKFNLKLDGETIVDIDVEIGYLHRGFEKMCEQGTWNHVFPYADRLNYASPLLNNVGFALAVEKLAGVDGAGALPVHPRHRRRDLAHHRPPHVPRHGRQRDRRHLGRLLHARGARVPLRPGRGDHRRAAHRHLLPARRRHRTTCRPTSASASRDALRRSVRARARRLRRAALAEPHLRRPHGRASASSPRGRDLVRAHRPAAARDRRRLRRPQGRALPRLRPLRLRRCRPARRGDNYDRFMVRMAEIEQSMRIVEQALAQMPDGPDRDHRSALRPAAEAGGLRLDRRPDEPLQAGHRGPEGAAPARSTSPPRAATASSASTW